MLLATGPLRADDVAQIGRGGSAEQAQGHALDQIGPGVDTADGGAGQTAEDGVLATAETQGAADEHVGHDDDGAQDDGDEVSKPRGVAGHLDGGDDGGDNTGADDLAHGQRVELGHTQSTGTRFFLIRNGNSHGENSFP